MVGLVGLSGGWVYEVLWMKLINYCLELRINSVNCFIFLIGDNTFIEYRR